MKNSETEKYYRNQLISAMKAYQMYCGRSGGIVSSIFFWEGDNFMVDSTMAGLTDYLKSFYAGGMGKPRHVEGHGGNAFDKMLKMYHDIVVMRAGNDEDYREELATILLGMPEKGQAPDSYYLQGTHGFEYINTEAIIYWFDKCIDYYMSVKNHPRFKEFCFMIPPRMISMWMSRENPIKNKSRYMGFEVVMDLTERNKDNMPYVLFTYPGGYDKNIESFENIITH